MRRVTREFRASFGVRLFGFCLAVLSLAATPAQADPPRFLFGTPVSIENITNPDFGDRAATLTSDGLEIFFDMGDGEDARFHHATRSDSSQPFGQPEMIEELEFGYQPSVSANGLDLYFIYDQGDEPPFEIHTASRPTRQDPFGEPTVLFEAPSVRDEYFAPFVSHDGLSLYVQRGPNDSAGQTIYVSTREDIRSLARARSGSRTTSQTLLRTSEHFA